MTSKGNQRSSVSMYGTTALFVGYVEFIASSRQGKWVVL
jgi:hypothetical protein